MAMTQVRLILLLVTLFVANSDLFTSRSKCSAEARQLGGKLGEKQLSLPSHHEGGGGGGEERTTAASDASSSSIILPPGAPKRLLDSESVSSECISGGSHGAVVGACVTASANPSQVMVTGGGMSAIKGADGNNQISQGGSAAEAGAPPTRTGSGTRNNRQGSTRRRHTPPRAGRGGGTRRSAPQSNSGSDADEDDLDDSSY